MVEKREEYSRMEDRDMLREDQWKRIAHMLPGKATDPGRSAADNRLFVEAVLFVLRTGLPWRDLPKRFGLWNSVYVRFSRWSRKGVWHRTFSELAKDADFEEVYLDGTIVRAHQHASGAQKKRSSSHRPLAWWIDDQDTRCRRRPRQSRVLEIDRRERTRQYRGSTAH